MISLLIRRIFLGAVTLWVVSGLVFAGTEILPGDVALAILGQSATPESVAAIRQQLQLDQPPTVRYVRWLSRMIKGELGESFATGRPIARVVKSWLWNSLLLAALVTLFVVPVSIALGLVSATYPESLLDRSISISSLVMISVPLFFTGPVFVLFFAVTFRLLPAVSYISEASSPLTILRALVLPGLSLILAVLAHMVRMTRAAILEVLMSPYIEMAILKGVSRGRIVFRHALPNALGPIINVIALNIGYLVSGVVVVEVIFAYPGLGRLMIDAVAHRDVPMVQVTAMILCTVYVVVIFVADLLVLATNPRLRRRK